MPPFHPHRLLLAGLGVALAVMLPAAAGHAEQSEGFTCTLPDDPVGSSRSAQSRIVGGSATDWQHWPWQASIQFDNRQGLISDAAHDFIQFCGGSIIHPQWILTAAHCFPAGVDARNTRLWHGGSRVGQGGRAHDIAAIFSHPRWNEATMENDIALIKLARPMENLPRGAVVQLQTPVQERMFAPSGTCSVVTGWGQMRSGDHPTSDTLQQVDVPIIDLETCRAAYRGRTRTPIHDSNLCAGYRQGTRDSCQGDSGGPLVVPDPNVPAGWTQTGIVSWGLGCAAPDSYGVYTRVAAFIPWIQSTVSSN